MNITSALYSVVIHRYTQCYTSVILCYAFFVIDGFHHVTCHTFFCVGGRATYDNMAMQTSAYL